MSTALPELRNFVAGSSVASADGLTSDDEFIAAECRNTGKPVEASRQEEMAPLLDECCRLRRCR